jgi:hypothetical protein
MKSKQKPTQEQPILDHPLPDKFTAVTVCRSNYLSSVAFEVEVENGQVVSIKPINKAPDVMAIVAGHCSSKLWSINRDQQSKDYK